MNRFNQSFLKILMLIALLPTVPPLLLGLPPAGLLLLTGVAYFSWAPFRRGVNGIFGGIGRGIGGIFRIAGKSLVGLLGGFGSGLVWLFGIRKPAARFMGSWERGKLLRSSHTGILVDGRKSRLSEIASYDSLLVQGGVGRGKSSTFVLPNLLSPPSTRPSFVISDTSGELFQNSSGYLARLGYQIRVFNLMDVSRSATYNPLALCQTPTDLDGLAKTLVHATHTGTQGSKDPFWDQSAEKLIRILAQCLMNQPDPAHRNLANLRHLILSFDAHVAPQGKLSAIDKFVLSATSSDPRTFSEYSAFVNGNLKTLQSVLMSADVALAGVATPEMAALTATNTLDLKELRGKPTALFVMVNQTQMDQYAFLLNLFYAQLFQTLLQNQHDPGRPVWLWLDEFGHLSVRGFETFATTARKYKVAYALFLQSMAQLDARYGALNARTVRDALGAEIYLPGAGLDVARELEARLGRTDKGPLMPANDIIRMDEDQALLLYSNRLPIMLKTRRYYQRRDLRRRARIRPVALPMSPSGFPPLIQL